NESLDFMQHWSAKNGVALSSDDAATCAETSAGNPFYLGELAAHTARGGELRLYPKSIRELIEIQYVAVSKGAQRLLLVIALFEGRGTLSRVTQIMDLGADEFMAALDELEEAGLITAKGAQVRCKHELVAETAIQLAMEGVQSFARVRIAAFLEGEADETNSVELLGDCVTHWERAGEMKRAYLAAMKLGNRLVGLGMGTEAEAAFQSARANAETSDEIIGAIEGQVTASRLCANWPRVISGVASRASWVPKRLRPSTCDTDFELADAEARMFAFDGSATVPRLISLACDRAASRDARLRAATITAMYGDNNYSLQHIREAWNSIGDLQQNIGEDLDHLLLEMVFHTTVGRTDLAQAIATQYGSNACADADKRVAVHGVRRAGNALIRIGQPREAQHFLEESLLMCKKFKLPYQEFASLDLLVTSHLAIGNLDTCHSLLNRMAEIGGESRTLHMRAMLFVGESLVAWLEGGAPRRRRWIESEQIDSDTWMLSPRHGFLNAILARAVLLDGVSEVSAVIEECERLHILGRDLGGQDLRTAILLDAMRVAGRRSESDILEVDYLSKHRRDMTPSVINFAPTRSRVVE
ncbi:MAG: hypothetical protein ABIT38_02945, partial [Gemmatimonadaceae bacterium]